MSASGAGGDEARGAFDRLLGELRPKLHRYCARMTGSVIDGEDVVQEALVKAIKAFPQAGSIAEFLLGHWLFDMVQNFSSENFERLSKLWDAIQANPAVLKFFALKAVNLQKNDSLSVFLFCQDHPLIREFVELIPSQRGELLPAAETGGRISPGKRG